MVANRFAFVVLDMLVDFFERQPAQREPALYAHKQEVLKRHCREVGRAYDTIRQVVRVGILIAETERDLERLKGAPGVRPMSDIRLAGTPDQVTDALRKIIGQGAHRLTVVTREILARRPDDPIHRAFVDGIVGDVWDDEVPDSYLDAIEMAPIDDAVRAEWIKALRLA